MGENVKLSTGTLVFTDESGKVVGTVANRIPNITGIISMEEAPPTCVFFSNESETFTCSIADMKIGFRAFVKLFGLRTALYIKLKRLFRRK